MEKVFRPVEISNERQKEIFNIVESVLDEDYETFQKHWENWWLWLWKIFFELWILKSRWNEKAIEFHNILSNTHRKISNDRTKEQNKKNKIIELSINKQNFCTKQKLDPDREKLYKLKEYEIWEDRLVVVWCTWINQESRTCFWWTTLISHKETPDLYDDAIKKYHRYYE